MRRQTTLSLILAGALIAPAYSATSSSDNTYREAVLQETTARDLEKAITLYDEVIQDPKAERGLKANAYLRTGICQNKLGKKDAARAAWSQVLENYADQPQTYQEAKDLMQELEVQTVQATPPAKEARRTRVALQFPSLGYSSTGGPIITGPSLHYYWNRRWATGLEYSTNLLPDETGQLWSDYSIDVTYYGLTTLREWTLAEVLRPYLKIGPALYYYDTNYDGGRNAWTGGVLTETGLSISAARGFFATFAIGLHAIVQPVIQDMDRAEWWPADWPTPTGSRSMIRGIWIPRFAIGYRW